MRSGYGGLGVNGSSARVAKEMHQYLVVALGYSSHSEVAAGACGVCFFVRRYNALRPSFNPTPIGRVGLPPHCVGVSFCPRHARAAFPGA